MKKELKSYKILDKNFPPNPPIKDAKLYVLNRDTEKVEVYITDMFGNPKPIKDDIGGSEGIYTFFSSNNTITISGTNNVNLILENSLKNLIESSLQPNDNISELVNDVGYVTQDSYISNIQFADNILTFTGVENAFNGMIDLSILSEPTIIEDLDSTQIIDIGDIGSSPIEVGFNAFTFIGDDDPVQDQADGYVIVYTIRNSTIEKYLFIGEGGNYGTTGSETAVSSDFVLLDDDFNYTNSNDVWRNKSGTQNAISYTEWIRHKGHVILDNYLYVGDTITSKYGLAGVKLKVTGNYGVDIRVGNQNNGNIELGDGGASPTIVFNGKKLYNAIFRRNYTLLSGSNNVTAHSLYVNPTIDFSGSTNSQYYGIHLDPNIVDLDGNEHYAILSENGKVHFKDTEFSINDYTLPTSDGTANQVLTTDGSGQVTWEDVSNTETSIEDTSVSGTYEIDLSKSNFELTLTGNTTLDVTNTPSLGRSVVVTLYITSDSTETLTIPASWNLYGDDYANDGTRNQLALSVSNNASSGLIYDLSISNAN